MSRAAKATVLVAAALVAIAALVRVLHGGQAAAPRAAAVSSSGYVGVAEPGEITSYQKVRQFEQSSGRRPDIVLYYSSWLERFQTRFAKKVHAHGAIPFVQISPGNVPMARIAAGDYDAYLRSYARQIRSYGHQVIVGFAPEMNGNWDSWGYGHTSPASWIAGWRHFVTVFRQQGASNVTWLWTINSTSPGTGPIQKWWPGPQYVSWVGIDGYYYLPSDTFRNAFGPTIAKVRTFTSRPILLSEVAIGHLAGQVQKIPDLFTGIRHARLLGLVWFDETQSGGLYHQDWRLENNPAAVAVFRREAQNYALPRAAPSHR